MSVNSMKNRKRFRRPLAVLTAAVLAFVMTPQIVAFGKVETTEDGGVKVTAGKDEVVNENRNTDIVAQKDGLFLEATGGGTINYTLNGNISAATGYGVRSGGAVTLKAGDVTAPEGRAFYTDFAVGSVTLGNLKSKDGISAMCTDQNALSLTTGNIETEKGNYLSNRFYGSAQAGNLTANFGDITSSSESVLALNSSRGGTMTVKAGKLTSKDGSALHITGSSGGKVVAEVGEIDATGPRYDATAIYSSGGEADIDVTVNGNAAARYTGLSLGDGGVYKIFGDVSTIEGEGIRAGSRYNDTDILITGTLNAAANGVYNAAVDKKFTLTLWKLKWGEKCNAFEGDDENETQAKAVNYIVKTVQPSAGSFQVVKADGTSALDKKTYKHGDKDVTFEVAHQGDRLYIKSDVKIVKAYNGSGADKVELAKDAEGNYYYDVVKGGGMEFSVELEGAEPTPSPSPTVEPGTEPTPEPTVSPATKKKNPMTVTVNRIYGKAKHTVTVSRKKAFNIKDAKGTLSFKKISGSKRFTINKKTGDIRIEQHLKKGKKYFMVVQVTAAGNRTYKAKSVKVELRIKIH